MPPFEAEADDGLDALIAAAVDRDAAGSAPEPPPEPIIQEAAPDGAEGQEVEDAEGASADRARDEKGRFAKAGEPVQDDAEIAAAPAPEGSEPEGPTTPPPHSLAPALKAKWGLLSPEVREEFHRLESGFQQAKNEWAPKGQALNALDAVLSPVDQRLALQGLSRQQYVQSLVAADELLRTNPLEGLRQVAALYGVNLGQQFGSAPTQEQPQGQAPQGMPEQFAPWLSQIEQKFGDLNQKLAQREQQEQEAEQTRLRQEIDSFRNNSENLYFENVRDDMARILAANLAPDLPAAYRMACWARDDIRPLMQAADAAKAAKAAQKAPAQPQKAAPAGAQINGGQPPSAADGAGRAANLSLEDQVAAALEEVAGRA